MRSCCPTRRKSSLPSPYLADASSQIDLSRYVALALNSVILGAQTALSSWGIAQLLLSSYPCVWQHFGKP